MKAGDVVLISLSQFGGATPKLRPALLLAILPGPYQTHLMSGISVDSTHHLPVVQIFQPGLPSIRPVPKPVNFDPRPQPSPGAVELT